MNQMKRIVAIMTSICLLVIIGIKVPMWLSEPAMETGEAMEKITAPEVNSPVEDTTDAEPIEEVLVSEPEAVEETPVSEILSEPEKIVKVEETEVSETTEMGELLDGVSDIDEDWVMRELNEHQDEIEQNDLEDGLAILDKIDANYLYEMSDDGFTEEEKAAAEEFLHAELSEEDVQAVWGLIHKYMELVD